jgi:hypothetical protein
MSEMLEIPDPVFAKLRKAAAASGLTPVDWIDAQLPQALESDEVAAIPESPKNLAEFLEGHIGVIDSGSAEPLSENPPELFTQYLEQKRRAGRL